MLDGWQRWSMSGVDVRRKEKRKGRNLCAPWGHMDSAKVSVCFSKNAVSSGGGHDWR